MRSPPPAPPPETCGAGRGARRRSPSASRRRSRRLHGPGQAGAAARSGRGSRRARERRRGGGARPGRRGGSRPEAAPGRRARLQFRPLSPVRPGARKLSFRGGRRRSGPSRRPLPAGHPHSNRGRRRCRHTAPRNSQVLVGGVLDRLQVSEGGQQIPAGEREQGADHGAVHRADAAEPFEAAAEHQAEEHGFGLIVPVMGGGDPAGAGSHADLLQELVAHPPGSGLGAVSTARRPPGAPSRRGRRASPRGTRRPGPVPRSRGPWHDRGARR